MQSPLFLLTFLLPLVVIALIAILNALTFPRLKSSRAVGDAPLVSILIPMRNEANVIEATVKSLLAQTYPNLEIILLDDQSSDASAQLAQTAAQSDPRFKLLRGEDLPPNWLGKPWACHQLSRHARGGYFLFTDADTRWHPAAVAALMHEAQRTRADLLTGWATQVTETWAERLVVPMMGFAVQAYLPIQAVHHLPFSSFAAANGQCLLFRRDAYNTIGGHAAIQDNILDDMGFAYAIKRSKLRLRAVEANGLIQTRMYRNWQGVRDGFAKNILAGHGNNPVFLFLSAIFHWWLFILPLVFAVFNSPTWLWLFALGVSIRALTAAVTRQRLQDAIFMPISVLLMTIIAAKSIHWHFNGGPQWKGRIIPQ